MPRGCTSRVCGRARPETPLLFCIVVCLSTSAVAITVESSSFVPPAPAPDGDVYLGTAARAPDSFTIEVVFDEPRGSVTDYLVARAREVYSSPVVSFVYSVNRGAACLFGSSAASQLTGIADPQSRSSPSVDGASLTTAAKTPSKLPARLVVAGRPVLLSVRSTIDPGASPAPAYVLGDTGASSAKPVSRFGARFLVFAAFTEPVRNTSAVTLKYACGAAARPLAFVDRVVPCTAVPTRPCVGSPAGPELTWANPTAVPPVAAAADAAAPALQTSGLLFHYNVSRGDACDSAGFASGGPLVGAVVANSDDAPFSRNAVAIGDAWRPMEYSTVIRSLPTIAGMRARLDPESPVKPSAATADNALGALGIGGLLQFFVAFSEPVEVRPGDAVPSLTFKCGVPRVARFYEVLYPCGTNPSLPCLDSPDGPPYSFDTEFLECGGVKGPGAVDECLLEDIGLPNQGLLFRYNVTRGDDCTKSKIYFGDSVVANADRVAAVLDDSPVDAAVGGNVLAQFAFAVYAPPPGFSAIRVRKGAFNAIAAAAWSVPLNPYADEAGGGGGGGGRASAVPVALPGQPLTFELRFREPMQLLPGSPPPSFQYTCSEPGSDAPKRRATFAEIVTQDELNTATSTSERVYYARFAASVVRDDSCGIGTDGTLRVFALQNATGLVAKVDGTAIVTALPEPPQPTNIVVQADDPYVMRVFFTLGAHPRDAANAQLAAGSSYTPQTVAFTNQLVYLTLVYSEPVVVRGSSGVNGTAPAPGTPYLNLTCGAGRPGAVPAVFSFVDVFDTLEGFAGGLIRVSLVNFAYRVQKDAKCGFTRDPAVPLGPLSNQTVGAGTLQPQTNATTRGWSLVAVLDGAIAFERTPIAVDELFNGEYTIYSGEPFVRNWTFFLATTNFFSAAGLTFNSSNVQAATVKDVVYIAVFYDQPVAVKLGDRGQAPYIPMRCGRATVNATARATFDRGLLGAPFPGTSLRLNVLAGTLGPFALIEGSGYDAGPQYREPGILFAFEVPEGAACGLDPASPRAFVPLEAVPPALNAEARVELPAGSALASRDGVFGARAGPLKAPPTSRALPFFVFTSPPMVLDVTATYLGRTLDASSPAIRIQLIFTRDITMEPRTPATPPRIDLSSGGLAEFVSFDARDPRMLNFRYKIRDGEETNGAPLTVAGPTAFDLRGVVIADALTGLYADLSISLEAISLPSAAIVVKSNRIPFPPLGYAAILLAVQSGATTLPSSATAGANQTLVRARQLLQQATGTPRTIMDTFPVPVSVVLQINNVYETKEADQIFTLDASQVTQWFDPSFTPYRDTFFNWNFTSQIWTPALVFANARDTPRYLSQRLRVDRGMVQLIERYLIRVNWDAINVREFPFDTQLMMVRLESSVYNTEKMVFANWNDARNASTVESVQGVLTSIDDGMFIFKNLDQVVSNVSSGISQDYSRLTVYFHAERRSTYHSTNIIFPLAMLMISSYFSFFLAFDNDYKMELVSTSIIGTLIYSFVILEALPPVAYLTRLTAFIAFVYAFQFSILVIQVTLQMFWQAAEVVRDLRKDHAKAQAKAAAAEKAERAAAARREPEAARVALLDPLLATARTGSSGSPRADAGVAVVYSDRTPGLDVVDEREPPLRVQSIFLPSPPVARGSDGAGATGLFPRKGSSFQGSESSNQAAPPAYIHEGPASPFPPAADLYAKPAREPRQPSWVKKLRGRGHGQKTAAERAQDEGLTGYEPQKFFFGLLTVQDYDPDRVTEKLDRVVMVCRFLYMIIFIIIVLTILRAAIVPGPPLDAPLYS
eukprot:tig00020553_g10501.t1